MNKHGLIIIGYPGIGKSSLAYSHSIYSRYIDLESSVFKIDNEKCLGWHIIYCRQAVQLAKQGFIVLVSSHEEVRKELSYYAASEDDVAILSITPSALLKDEWITKLHERYLAERTLENKRPWERARDNFDRDICDITTDSNFSHIFIMNMNYDLKRMVQNLYDIYCTNNARRML